MSKILLASTNPVKVAAVKDGFERMLPGEKHVIEPVSIKPEVPDQPMTDQETLNGAVQRTLIAREQYPEADYWVGIEGGVQDEGQTMAAFAWVVIRSPDQVGRSKSGTFYLPGKIAQLIREGLELGEADDIIFGQTDSKRKNGAIGLLTGDVITRKSLYEHAVILALVPFKNKHFYDS